MRFLVAFVMAFSFAGQQPPVQKPPAQQPPVQKPPVNPAAGASQSPTTPAVPVQGPYEFTTDIGAFLIVIQADKAPMFDAAMAKLKQAFASSKASNDRRRQAAGWRVFKSAETPTPGTPAIPAVPATATSPAVAAVPAGPATITYLFLIDPVAKKSSYDPIEIIKELLPDEVQSTYDQLQAGWVSATRIGLTELLKMGGS